MAWEYPITFVVSPPPTYLMIVPGFLIREKASCIY